MAGTGTGVSGGTQPPAEAVDSSAEAAKYIPLVPATDSSVGVVAASGAPHQPPPHFTPAPKPAPPPKHPPQAAKKAAEVALAAAAEKVAEVETPGAVGKAAAEKAAAEKAAAAKYIQWLSEAVGKFESIGGCISVYQQVLPDSPFHLSKVPTRKKGEVKQILKSLRNVLTNLRQYVMTIPEQGNETAARTRT